MDIDPLRHRLNELLAADDAARAARYPGPMIARQPIHTVYVPGDRFSADTVSDWGAAAIDALNAYGPLPDFDRYPGLERQVHEKLRTEPIEDLRIDFEDGYGLRPDETEDRDVIAAARALRAATQSPSGGPLALGIRMKSLEGPFRDRGLRTVNLFLESLVASGETTLPAGFRLTLPKVSSVAQVLAMVEACGAFEDGFSLPEGALRFEIQIETPQAVLGEDGTALVARMIHAAGSRCAGLHYGTYDYSASVGIAAAFQSMEHPAADHAKAVMQVAAAGTGVPVSDGSTNMLPVGDAVAVRSGWALHARLVRRSLERGFYQGWDLHPAQLPTRFAATFAFYLDGLPAAVGRLQRYLSRSASGILDEPATAQALAGFLARGLDCGAFGDRDILEVAQAVAPDGLVLDRTLLNQLAKRG
ncbi:HpcH/HpaI aldolase/citrate lyase family protein [Jatrophihabitans telluris]|uniref:HpcH/HpaI aldolase/citrate lyase family protein n=1 Tax=Jatrophihabitans telluris TaxID=2038343 RepID=A0ABY4QWZ4_9ACTN|nr:aldolase/citrate lyase family protein [Jatrophihabitans telluris]UQX88196.1 HpcH/HpaI aldolase/citrate lyase family protein [Jatrophihabitans telluris]